MVEVVDKFQNSDPGSSAGSMCPEPKDFRSSRCMIVAGSLADLGDNSEKLIPEVGTGFGEDYLQIGYDFRILMSVVAVMEVH